MPAAVEWATSRRHQGRCHIVWYRRDAWAAVALCGLSLDGCYPWLGDEGPPPALQCGRCIKMKEEKHA